MGPVTSNLSLETRPSVYHALSATNETTTGILPGMQSTLAPLLTLAEHSTLLAARDAGAVAARCSLNLGRSVVHVEIHAEGWTLAGVRYPYLANCRARTIYFWDGGAFLPAARFSNSLIKLVPTEWGAPTFEIDGIKMLPTSRLSPYEDAKLKVALIEPRGKVIVDTCGGLGYFAAWCITSGAAQILSYEKNPDVLWLRGLNPWSPIECSTLTLRQADVTAVLPGLAARSVDAILHDPPRFGIAGELYSRDFYLQMARVLKPGGRLFHYTGSPNKLTSGRNLGREVLGRLHAVGFAAERVGDGILAVRR